MCIVWQDIAMIPQGLTSNDNRHQKPIDDYFVGLTFGEWGASNIRERASQSNIIVPDQMINHLHPSSRAREKLR